MTTRFFIAFIFLVFAARPQASAADTLFVRSLKDITNVPVIRQAAYLLDESNSMDWRTAMLQPFATRHNLNKYIDSVCGHRRVTVWLRVSVVNEMEDSLRLMLMFYRYSFFKEVVVLKPNDTIIKRPNYFFTSETKQERNNFITPLVPGDRVTYLIRIFNPYANLYAHSLLLTNRKAYLSARGSMYHRSFSDYIFKIMFLAVVVFITLHTLAQYFIRRRKEFLFYAFYSASVFLFFLYRLEHSIYYDVLFSHFPYVYKFSNNLLSYIVYYAYFRFAREFVNFEALAPWFHKVIIWTERTLIVAFAVDLASSTLLNNYQVREIIFTILRIGLLIISFIGIYLLLWSGRKVLYFFGIGSLLLIIGSLLAMIFTFYPNANPYPFEAIRYMQYGIVLELLCFTSGLSYKSHLIEVEKQNTQQQLIYQLEENHRLQEELNIKLEARVNEQTTQILEQQRQLEKEREQQLTLEFTKKITEMELQLLKSQLNPHFYFNTLNNLYGLSMIAPKKAPDAILKLSDIMEYVIYDCRNDKVALNKELRFIRSYIELERLRYEDNTNIQLNISGEPGNKSISPLLLIQFIENAFKHGMEQHKADSYLHIDIHLSNGTLHYKSVNSIKETPEREGGLGLVNVRKRLEILYPGKHKLNIHTDSKEFIVSLALELN
ncbi:MAG TPA: histidine kinase [Chitinophagaceae bacterium]|nr:histidine kinase [Chitinophagaceae bacterium]